MAFERSAVDAERELRPEIWAGFLEAYQDVVLDAVCGAERLDRKVGRVPRRGGPLRELRRAGSSRAGTSRGCSGGSRAERAFRFWTGEDTDANVVIDEDALLYVASELERFTSRAHEVGPADETRPGAAQRSAHVVVPDHGARVRWSRRRVGHAGPSTAGWCTSRRNHGDLIGLDPRTGDGRWRIRLAGPTWSSPVPIDDVPLQGDCGGTLHAFDISKPLREPPELWSLSLGSCIESTPSVLEGMIWVGTRGGGVYGIEDRRG